VFVVGYLGDWQRPAAVLFESESVCRNPAPSREARQETAKYLTAGVGKRYDFETETLPVAFDWQSGGDSRGLDPKDTAQLQRSQVPAVAQPTTQFGDIAGSLTARHDSSPCADRGANVVTQPSMQVRRLTPVECERLQGLPDNYTNIPWRKSAESPDGPRYKALGNSMAVPVMRWIGKRIANVGNR
jgi:DNA (cytosine-5)-methyltransferase 1